MLLGGVDASEDPTADGLDVMRSLWTGSGLASLTLRTAVAATAASRPRPQLPIIIAHGECDGLLPIAFASGAYVDALDMVGQRPVYWRVPHAQHFDAFLSLAEFGNRHVPLMPYGYAALDALLAHLTHHVPLPSSHRFATAARGNVALQVTHLGMALPRHGPA